MVSLGTLYSLMIDTTSWSEMQYLHSYTKVASAFLAVRTPTLFPTGFHAVAKIF